MSDGGLPSINQKYGVDNSDFKTGMAAMSRAIRVLESDFKANAAQLGDWSDSASGLESRMAALTKLIDVQKDKVAAARIAWEEMAQAHGENSREADEARIRLNKETEQLNKYERELGDSSDKLDEMKKATSDAGREVGNLENKTHGASGALDKLQGVVSGLGSALKIGIGAMVGLATAAAGVGAAIGGLVLKSADAAGELVDMSAQTGITVERLQELSYIGNQVGTGADTMVQAMARLTRSMGKARDDTVDFQKSLGEAANQAAEAGAQITEEYGQRAAKVQAKLVETERSLSDERTKIQDDLGKKLTEIANSTTRDLQKLQEDHLEKIGKLEASIASTTADYEYDKAERAEDTQRDITRMTEDYQHDREKLTQDLSEAESDAEKARIQSRIDDLDYEYNTKKKRREEDAKEAEQDAEHQKDQKIKALQAQLDAESAEYDKAQKAIRERNLEQQQSAQDRYKVELDSAQARYDGEVQAATAAMAEIATARDEALKGVSNSQDDKKMSDTAQAFDTLGVSVTDANGQLRDNEAVMADVLTALANVPNETERDALAMAIFGKSAQELNPLIKAGADEISRLTDEAHRVGAVMSEDSVSGLEAFGDTLQGLKDGLKGTLGELATAFLPGFSALADTAGIYLGKFSEIVRGADGDLVKMAEGVGQLLGEMIGDFAERGPALLEAGLKIVQGILNAISTNLPMLLDGAVKIINMLVKFIVDNLPMMVKTGVQILLTLVKALITNLPMLVEAGIDALLALIDGLTEALPELIPIIVDAVLTITQTLLEHLPEIVEAGGKLLLAIVKGLMDALPIILEKAPEIIHALAEALIAIIPILAQVGLEMLKIVATGIVENLPEMGKALKKTVDYMNEAVRDLAVTLWETGKNLLLGVLEGIGRNKDWFFNEIKNFFRGTGDAANEGIDAHSPSKLFAGVGENAAGSYVDSLGQRLRNGARQLQAAFADTAPDLAFNAPVMAPAMVGAAGAGSAGARAGDTYNVTINYPAQQPGGVLADVRLLQMLYGGAA